MQTILPDYLFRRYGQGKRGGNPARPSSFSSRSMQVARKASHRAAAAWPTLAPATTSESSQRLLSSLHTFGVHAIDAVGLVHALLLRIQALMLPIRELVFNGH
jgi:hypothetical protein